MPNEEQTIVTLSSYGAGNSFENYRTELVTTIGFLIGISEETFSRNPSFDAAKLAELQQNEDAKTIRHLSKLRTQFLRNYEKINGERFSTSVTPLENMDHLLSTESITYLREKGMEVAIVNYKGSPNITINVAYINQYLLDNIDRIRPLIPEWVKYEYIRSLFLMPNCYAGQKGINLDKQPQRKQLIVNIQERRGAYIHQRTSYPYQLYLTWPIEFRETDGNILYNDAKFLKLLYGANRDIFKATEYVIDAKTIHKDTIYDFVDTARQIALFVDCENVDPYCFAATLLNLDSDNLQKVKQIVLYDDVNTSTAWDYFEQLVNLPIKHVEINRVLDNKSLVDITMTAGVCEEYYKENTESIVLVSSDSDFWGLITSLPLARFYVLNEGRKTSPTIIAKLDESGISHCFMDEFAQDKVQQFKTRVLSNSLGKRIKEFNETGHFEELVVDELIKAIFREACISGADKQMEQERKVFYNTFLKKGLLIKPVEEDGKLILKMSLAR